MLNDINALSTLVGWLVTPAQTNSKHLPCLLRRERRDTQRVTGCYWRHKWLETFIGGIVMTVGKYQKHVSAIRSFPMPLNSLCITTSCPHFPVSLQSSFALWSFDKPQEDYPISVHCESKSKKLS